ncbi:twin-arginine translocation signal domain-containing protein [Nitratireductor thuwali]|uniref:Alpha/beta hydrolase n=1 Tax=Nitratireductor thuwali TaxID=2267699 RepID=A0ABY5MMD1_9HYPH|nr:hypothetical protein NTH_01487 [Nitratireductor thuwali]
MHRRTFLAASAATVAVPALTATAQSSGTENEVSKHPVTGYVEVNDLHIYYESHGSGGVPLVLLHHSHGWKPLRNAVPDSDRIAIRYRPMMK